MVRHAGVLHHDDRHLHTEKLAPATCANRMRPPICDLCGRDAGDGELVSFRDYAPLPQGMTGHPRGRCWFCARHAAAAKALTHLDTGQAFARLRRKFRWHLVAANVADFVHNFFKAR